MFLSFFSKSKSLIQSDKSKGQLHDLGKIYTKSLFNLLQQKIANAFKMNSFLGSLTTEARLATIQYFYKLSFENFMMGTSYKTSHMLNEMSLGFIQMGMPEMCSLIDKLASRPLSEETLPVNNIIINTIVQKK